MLEKPLVAFFILIYCDLYTLYFYMLENIENMFSIFYLGFLTCTTCMLSLHFLLLCLLMTTHNTLAHKKILRIGAGGSICDKVMFRISYQ